MSDGATREEHNDVAAAVIAGVLVAVSLALGLAAWLFRSRMEQIFKELGVQLPGITIIAFDPIAHVIALMLLAGCAAMIAIRGLRVIGISAWVIALFLYLGFWAVGFGLPTP